MTDLDSETVRLAQAGNESACRTILEELHRPVIATIYRFLGSGYRNEVEDIAQDVFLKVFRSIGRFDSTRGVKFTTWVYTFVRNHCFDVLKKRKLKTATLSSSDGDERQREIEDRLAVQPRNAAQNEELGRQIESALAALGEDQRMAFVLREYEGLDYGAIAQVMGVSEGTVKSRLHRAKQALRSRLAPYLRTGS